MAISPESTADNRRSCVRFSSLNTDERVMLSDGSKRLEVYCTDRSAEGFGFCCDSTVPWTVGQTVLLSREEGEYEVRIAYILERDGKGRIGVQRVRDVADSQSACSRFSWKWLRRHAPDQGKSDLWLIGLCFASLACVAVVAMILRPVTASGDGKRTAARHRVTAHPTQLFSALLGEQFGSSDPAPADWNAFPQRPAKSSGDLWHEIVSGTREVTWTDIETLLGLSKDQSHKLLALLNSRLTEVSSRLGKSQTNVTDSRAHLKALIESLPDQSLAFLNDEQRAKLKTLLTSLSQL